MLSLMEAANQPVSRLVEAPDLTKDEIKEITRLTFYAPKPQPSDALLIFGAPEGDWSSAAKAYHDGLVKLIVASGGIHERTHGISEAELIKQALIERGVPAEVIITDSAAANTGENAAHFKTILDEKGVAATSVMYLCLRHHAGRCYLTLRKYFPHANISAITHGLLFSGLDITAENWMHDPNKVARVYGEYQRILDYSKLGFTADPSYIL